MNCNTCANKKYIGSICGCDGVYSRYCFTPKSKPTNADRVRANPTDRELAEMRVYINGDYWCCMDTSNAWKTREKAISDELEWLKQEAEEQHERD